MDTVKVGAFLKQLRKESNLTQEQLGEKLGVTNKTISRWENGNYLPPIECLEILSKTYHISINEIIAGERVSSDEFTQVADSNLSRALNDLQSENKRFEKRMLLILALTTILAIAIIILLPLKSLKDIAVFVMVILMAFIANMLNLVALAEREGREEAALENRTPKQR